MSKRKTKEEWQSESDNIHNFEFEIIGEPLSGQHLVNILHKKCGRILHMRPNNHLKRYCKFCSKKSKKSKEDWQNLSNLYHNFEFEIIDDIKSGKEKVNILHKKCGNIISMTMNNHINHKNGCKKCSKNSLKDNNHWLSKSMEIWGNDYTILDEVNNVHTKVNIRHNICGNIMIKNMDSFIHGKRGCITCTLGNKKYGEDYIENFLTNNSISFEKQKSFSDLRNKITGRNLYIDFWLKDYKVGIEVNGLQHYVPINHWGGQEAFDKQVYRDKIKSQYFIDNGYTLININNKQLTKFKIIWEQLQKNRQKVN